MKKLLLTLATIVLTIGAQAEVVTFTKVTSSTDLVNGAEYVIITSPASSGSVKYGPAVMTDVKTGGFNAYELAKDATSIEDSYDIDLVESNATVLTLVADSEKWKFQNGTQYLNSSENKKLKLSETATSYEITISTTGATIKGGYSNSTIQCSVNNGAGGVKGTYTINNYTTTQKPVYLFKKNSKLVAGSIGVKLNGESVAENDVPDLLQGDTFTFTSENATKLLITGEGPKAMINTSMNFENGVVTWTPITEGVYDVTLTAMVGDDETTKAERELMFEVKAVTQAATPIAKVGDIVLEYGDEVYVDDLISLSSVTEDADITYSITYKDDDSHNVTNAVYSEPFALGIENEVVTITAVAKKTGLDDSEILELALVSKKHESGLEFDAEEVIGYLDDADNFNAPKLINPNNLTVVYSSDDETVATVDPSTGVVTFESEGETIITATFPGDATYKKDYACYYLTVGAECPKITEFTATFDFMNKTYGHAVQSGNSQTYDALNSTYIEGPVTLTVNADKCVRLWSAKDVNELRVLKAGTAKDGETDITGFTLSVNPEYVITKIELTKGSQGNTSAWSYNGSALDENQTNWTGSEESVKVINTLSSANSLYTIKVTLEGMPISKPVFDEYAENDRMIRFKAADAAHELHVLKTLLDANGNPISQSANAPMKAIDTSAWTNKVDVDAEGYHYINFDEENVPEDGQLLIRAKSVYQGIHSDEITYGVTSDGVVTGVKTIETESTTAVPAYFNLQGVRVENPANGLFIRVTDGKAIKIMK